VICDTTNFEAGQPAGGNRLGNIGRRHPMLLIGAAWFAMTSGTAAIAVPTFTNVTSAIGITHVQSAATGAQAMTGGVAAADFDGDGLVDLFFTRVDAPDVMYRNTGSGFEDVSAASGFTAVLPTNGVAAGDVDNDGDVDLYVTGSESMRHYLYINDGAGHFMEDAPSRGADVRVFGGTTDRRGQGVALGDYDRDGYLDIMTSDHSRPTATSGSRLLHNLGAANPGHFADVTHAAGLDVYRTPLAVTDPPNSYRFQPQFTDLDRDGQTDIVFSADSRTSQLFWNNGDGTFTDGTVAAGVGTDKSGMGTALGDYDRDGDFDWFVTAIYDTTFIGANPGNRLYRNNGNRTFTDVTTAAGVRNTGPGLSWGWGTTFFDYDNDADLDLIATDGFISGYTSDRTTLWRNDADGTFTDGSISSGITDTGQGRGLLHVDYDSDGDLDIVIANYAAAPIVYRNDGGNDANWLRVRPVGTISNRDGIGAVIKVVPDLNNANKYQVWEINSGGSYLSQSEMTAHFGLGDFQGPIDLVEVEWPSGLVQRYAEVAINSLLVAEERLPGDYNGDHFVDSADYVVWRKALGMTGIGLPADGSGPNGRPDEVVDLFDYAYWRANSGQIVGGGSGGDSIALGVPEPSVTVLNMILLVAAGRLCLMKQSSRQRSADHILLR
jgi:hypothetical protein